MTRSRLQRSILVASGLTLALAVAACGGSGAATAAPATSPPSAPAAGSPSTAPAAGGDAVQIADFAFSPASITVAAGSTVTWTNGDSAGHTVTADDGTFDSSTIANGDTFSQAFPDAGSFAYHCAIHPNMKATVVVQ
jgi:plastocyanin